MVPNLYILVIGLVFVALWLLTRSEEHMASGSVGLDGTTRMGAGGVAGPRAWAPALINAENVAEGSPCRVPFDWIPTS